MKKIQIILFAILMALPMVAQHPGDKGPGGKGDRENWKKWFKEMREFKHQYMVKELELTDKQKQDFFAVYDKMEDELGSLNREIRTEEDQLRKKGDDVSDQEYERVSKLMFEQKQKEASIEQTYYPKLKAILTPKQLFKLKNVEWRFTRELMDQHKRISGKEKGKGPGQREHENRK